MQSSKTEKLLWDDDQFAKKYSSAEKLTGYFGTRLLEQAGIAKCPSQQSLVILDNACGTGVITNALQEILKDRSTSSVEITCGDFADAMVQTVSRRISDAQWANTKALKVDAQDTKLPGAHFTHVFTNFGPMLFPNSSAMLSECNRMLRPGGVCGFTTWKKIGWVNDIREAFSSMPDLPPFPSDEKMATIMSKGRWTDEDYVEEQLIQHGFTDIDINALAYTSTSPSVEDLRSQLSMILGIGYRMWTQDEREKHATQDTSDRIERWLDQKYHGGPIDWHWVALVTTSKKP